LTLTLAIVLIWAGGGWLIGAQEMTPASTYAGLAALITTMVAVSISLWKNGRANVAAEAAAGTGGARPGVRARQASREAV